MYNLQYRYKKLLPVYIHNSKGHFLVSAFNTFGLKEDNKITCISSTEEKYISFNKTIKLDECIYRILIPVNVYFEI